MKGAGLARWPDLHPALCNGIRVSCFVSSRNEPSIFSMVQAWNPRVLTASGVPLKFTPMSNAQPLNAQQIAHFKLNGYLVLKDVFNEETLEAWRRQIWRALDGCLEDPATWPRETSGLDG